jgi:hypothetical protein
LAPDTNQIPKIVGKLLYYARAVDGTLNVTLSSLSSEQAHPTQHTKTKVNQLLDDCHTNPNAGIAHYASDMFLHLHSDAGYNSESGAPSRAGGHLYLTNYAPKLEINNGAILNPTHIIKHATSSAAVPLPVLTPPRRGVVLLLLNEETKRKSRRAQLLVAGAGQTAIKTDEQSAELPGTVGLLH